MTSEYKEKINQQNKTQQNPQISLPRGLGRPAPTGYLTCRMVIYSQQGNSWAKATSRNVSWLTLELLHIA